MTSAAFIFTSLKDLPAAASRAARLMDELEELGIVGPSQGAGREREVFFGPEDENPLLRQRDDEEEE
jgi:hypothetical protein